MLSEAHPDSEDVFMPILIEDHYPARPDSVNDMCLYDFVERIDKNEKTLEFPIIHCLILPDR